MRRCVWSRNLVNEEALAHWGLSRQEQYRTANGMGLDVNERYAECPTRRFTEIISSEANTT